MNRENAWTTYEEADIKALEGLCKEYKDFLSNGKTERECVHSRSNWQRKAGYQDLEELIKKPDTIKKRVNKSIPHMDGKKRSHLFQDRRRCELKMD